MLGIPIPFQEEINDLFHSDQQIALKMGAGAFVGALVSSTAMIEMADQGGGWIGVIGVLFSAFVGAIAVIILSMKDVVKRRMQENQRVSPILRLCFGYGMFSLVFSIVSFFFLAAFAIIVVFGHMGL